MQTEHPFVLPRGFLSSDGETFREGTIRMARAEDEIHVLGDARVAANRAYAVVLLIARVVVRLGPLEGDAIDESLIEQLFSADLAHLQDRYREINGVGIETRICPHCGGEV